MKNGLNGKGLRKTYGLVNVGGYWIMRTNRELKRSIWRYSQYYQSDLDPLAGACGDDSGQKGSHANGWAVC